MSELRTAETECILVPSDRVRKEFDKEKLQKLAASFERLGQLQPGVCVDCGEGKFQLVAGERRFRACQLAKIPYTFILRSEADPAMLLEIELEENLNRVDLDWKEEVFGLQRLHEVREKQRLREGKKQTLMDTAAEVERSLGSVHMDLELAEWAKEFAEVRDAKNKAEARKVIKRYKGELVRNQLLGQATSEAAESKALTEEHSGVIEARLKEYEERGTIDGIPYVEGQKPKPEDADTLVIEGVRIKRSVLLDYDQRVILGRMEEQIGKFQDESIQIVLFDPPWRVDYDTVKSDTPTTEIYADENTPEAWETVAGNLRILWQKMAPDSHIYMFFGITHHERVYSLLESVGFVTNRIPLIWYKSGARRTRNPEIWPGRSYEPIAFGRKGGKKLASVGADVIITPAPTPTLKSIHPSAKHPDIYLELLKRSAAPGDTVLDPMAGSCMAAVAAEVHRHGLKLDWWMIEEKQEFRDLGLMNVIKGYSNLISKPKEPIETPQSDEDIEREISVKGLQYDIPPTASDYKALEPGTPEWMRFWKAHPEAQAEMLAWRKEQGK